MPTEEEVQAVRDANPGAEVLVEGDQIIVQAASGMAGSALLGGPAGGAARAMSQAVQGAMAAGIMYLLEHRVPMIPETADVYREMQMRARAQVLQGVPVDLEACAETLLPEIERLATGKVVEE